MHFIPNTDIPFLTVPRPETFALFTRCERIVCRLAAHGYCRQEIAALLHRSEKTIDKHLSHAMQKLGINRQTLLVRWWFTNASILEAQYYRLHGDDNHDPNRDIARLASTPCACQA